MSIPIPAAGSQPAEAATVAPVRVAVSWSGGKDCALALDLLLDDPRVSVATLVTSVTESAGVARIAMHGIRRDLVAAQASALGLPLVEVALPAWPSNEVYTARMRAALAALRLDDIQEIVYGDLFLEDVRAFREPILADCGLRGTYPLWGRDTGDVALELLGRGHEAVVVCVDPARLASRFCGRPYDTGFIAELPPGVDPCGERGEFHTFVYDGPRFSHVVPIAVWPPELRDGFWYCDVT